MKKQLLSKIFTALFILAVSAFFVNLQGQVGITFVNDSADAGNSATGGIDPLTLNFNINDEGKISLNASAKNPNVDVQRVVNGWDSDSVGNTDNVALFGKTFSLVVTTDRRLQCQLNNGGGLGTQGRNQWRMDDGGAESIFFTLYGDVGLEFTKLFYNDFNDDSDNGNFRLQDFDSDKTYYLDAPVITGDTVYELPAGEMKMRYQTDSLYFSVSDTITGSTGSEGGRLYGLEFEVLEAEANPLPVNEFALEFFNPTPDARFGNPDGLNPMAFAYSIDGSGVISVDASTESENADNIQLVNSWDSDNVGTTDIASLFNTSFTLNVTTNKRIQNDYSGGLGVQGRNQWRIDDGGSEYIYFVMEGDVGLDLRQFKFTSLNDIVENDTLLDLGHLRWMDYDTDKNYFIDDWSVDVGFENVPEDELLIRYRGDSLAVTTSDTITGDAGAKLYGMVFNLREALPKIPAVLSTSPEHADTLVSVTTDYVISFDNPMNQEVTNAAISISPAVANRVNTWDGDGKVLTISFDDLSFYTQYSVTVGQGVEGVNELSPLSDSTFTFQTLPDAPTVIETYPVDEAENVPAASPVTIEFSTGMNRDSVENALSFNPAVDTMMFSWNRASTKVVVSAELATTTQYTVTVNTNATDAYGVSFAEPAAFTFRTATPVAVENATLRNIKVYPNPTSDVLYISGMEVSSIKVFNLSGSLLKTQYNSKEINVHDIKPGSYILSVSDMDGNKLRKMIVKQ